MDDGRHPIMKMRPTSSQNELFSAFFKMGDDFQNESDIFMAKKLILKSNHS